MTALVSVLERAGLVERRGDPADKRVALVALTAAGADLLRARRRAGAEAFVQLIDKLPPGEAAALVAAIPALRHLRELDTERRGSGDPITRRASPGDRSSPERRSAMTDGHVALASPFRQPKGGVGGRVRLRGVVHGHRPGRPDPARAVQAAEGVAELGGAAVHQLPGGHRGGDAGDRLGVEPDRRQADAGRGPGPDRGVQRAGRARRTRSAGSSASGPGGAWATPCSSPPRWP